jgi:hypothetical protein
MKKVFILVSLLVIFCFTSAWAQQSASATYNLGDIPTTHHWDPGTNDAAAEPGVLTVTIPAGVMMTGVDVEYDMTAHTNNGWMEYQKSYMICVSPGGIAEPEISSGPAGGSQGTHHYSRTDLDIANNVYANEITFELHAFRTWPMGDSNTDSNYVVNGTWTVTVHYQSPEFDNDMAAVGISGPVIANIGQVSDYIITVANFGSQPQDNYTVKLKKEGGVEVTSEVVTVNLGTYEAVDVTLSWTPNEQGETYVYGEVVLVGDQNAGNDMTENFDVLVVGAALEGTYVINHDGTGHYPSFTSAVDDMINVGVNGPVVFEVAPGTYTEQIQIPEIMGVSETNTVTFIGSGARNESILFYEPNFTNRHLVMLNGAKFINFENLVFTVGEGAQAGNQFQIRDGSEHINIIGNVFNSKVTTSTNFVHVIISNTNFWTGAGDSHNIVLEDNIFNDGYAAFRPNGTSANRLTGIEVRNNVINEAYFYGLYLTQIYAPTIEGNLITTRAQAPTTSVAVGIWLVDVHGPFVIYGNEIYNNGQYGIYFSNGQTSPTERSQIVNNSIGGGFRNSGTFSGGIRILGTVNNLDIFFNSFNADFGNGTALYIGVTTVTGLDIRNNSFANTGGGTGYAMYLQGTVIPVSLDYNNYYSNGSNFVYYGSALADLAALQAVNAPANNDQNSLQGNPMYTSATNLFPDGPQLYQMGTPIPGIEEDIQGTLRPDPPCIGAYEFAPAPVPEFSVMPSSHDFGLVEAVFNSVQQAFVLTNTGGGDGSITIAPNDITIVNDAADVFTLSDVTEDIVLFSGDSESIFVTFTPTADEVYTATLQIEDNLGERSDLQITRADRDSRNTGERVINSVPLSGEGFSRPAGSTCANPYIVTLPVVDYQDNTEAYGNDYNGTMIDPWSGFLNGYDFVVQFELEVAGHLTGSVAATWENIGLFILDQTPAPSPNQALVLVSATDWEIGEFSDVLLPAGTYYGIVSNWPGAQFTDFTLNISFVPSVFDLDIPAVSIEVVNGEAILTWDAVDGANSYKIYVSADPYAESVDWDYQTAVGVPGYTEAVVDEKRFYRVVASTEEVGGAAISAPGSSGTTEVIQSSR